MRAFRIAVLLALVSASAAAQSGSSRDNHDRESAYAALIAHVADSAIRRLDFFPARAQVRAQMLFLAPADSSRALFAELARRSVTASRAIADLSDRFQGTQAPDDLRALHAQLVESLSAAASALERLSRSANACATDMTASDRCQSPFTSASSAVGKAYESYLNVRARIGEQIRDSDSALPEWAVGRRP